MFFLPLFLLLSSLICASRVEKDSNVKTANTSHTDLLQNVQELTFVTNVLPYLYRLSFITDYFRKEKTYLDSKNYGITVQPFEKFLNDVYAHFHLNGKWEGTFWGVCNNHNHDKFRDASRISIEKAMEVALGSYDIKLERNINKKRVTRYLQTLCQKHFPLSPNFTVKTETMFIFLTFLVHRLDVPVEAVIVNNSNNNGNNMMMDMDNETEEDTKEMIDVLVAQMPPIVPAHIDPEVIDLDIEFDLEKDIDVNKNDTTEQGTSHATLPDDKAIQEDLLTAVVFSDANIPIPALANNVRELIFVAKYLHNLCRLSLVTDFYLNEVSYLASEHYGKKIRPFQAFFDNVRPYFAQCGSWERTFWAVSCNVNHTKIKSASLVNFEEVMKTVLECCDLNLEEVSKDSVKSFLTSLYQKHYSVTPLTPNFYADDEILFIFLTFVVYRIGVAKTIENDIRKISQMDKFFDHNEDSKTSFINKFMEHAEPIYQRCETKSVESKWSNVFLKNYDAKIPGRDVEISKRGIMADLLRLHFPETPTHVLDGVRYCTDLQYKEKVEEFFKATWKDTDFSFKKRTCVLVAVAYLAYNLPAQ